VLTLEEMGFTVSCRWVEGGENLPGEKKVGWRGHQLSSKKGGDCISKKRDFYAEGEKRRTPRKVRNEEVCSCNGRISASSASVRKKIQREAGVRTARISGRSRIPGTTRGFSFWEKVI